MRTAIVLPVLLSLNVLSDAQGLCERSEEYKRRCSLRVDNVMSDVQKIIKTSLRDDDYEDLHGFLAVMKAFLSQCGTCLESPVLHRVCSKADNAAELLEVNLGLKRDFFEVEIPVCKRDKNADMFYLPDEVVFQANAPSPMKEETQDPSSPSTSQQGQNVKISDHITGTIQPNLKPCSVGERGRCATRFPQIVTDVKDMCANPSEHDDLKDYLLTNIRPFLQTCKRCILKSEIGIICDKADDAVELLGRTIGLEEDYFHIDVCDRANFGATAPTPPKIKIKEECHIVEKRPCAQSVRNHLGVIRELMSPPTDYEELRYFVGIMSSYVRKCAKCLMTSQLHLICDASHEAVEILIDSEEGVHSNVFNEDACKSENFKEEL